MKQNHPNKRQQSIESFFQKSGSVSKKPRKEEYSAIEESEKNQVEKVRVTENKRSREEFESAPSSQSPSGSDSLDMVYSSSEYTSSNSSGDEGNNEEKEKKIKKHLLRNIRLAVDVGDGKDRMEILKKLTNSRSFKPDFLNEIIVSGDESNGVQTTRFIEAVKSGKEDLVSLLIAKGADRKAKVAGNSPLMAALKLSPVNLKIIGDIVCKSGIESDDDEMARQINESFSVTRKNKKSGNKKVETNVFIEQIKKGNADVVSLLIEAGANRSIQIAGNSPLLTALKANPIDLDIVKALFHDNKELKTKINDCAVGGMRPLAYALEASREDVYSFLVEMGATERASSRDKKASLGRVEPVVKVRNLLSEPIAFRAIMHGFSVAPELYLDLYDEEGRPLVYWAIGVGRGEEIMSDLINSGREFSITGINDSNDENIFSYCLIRNEIKSANILEKYARSKGMQDLALVRTKLENEINFTPLELFAVDGSEESKDFLKNYIKKEDLDKFIRFAREKHALSALFSNLDSSERKCLDNKGLKILKVVRDIASSSELENFEGKEDIIEAFDHVINKDKRIELNDDRYLEVRDVDYNDHMAYFILERDSKTDNLMKVSYCDGNCPIDFFGNDNSPDRYGYGVVTFVVDQDKLAKLGNEVEEILDSFKDQSVDCFKEKYAKLLLDLTSFEEIDASREILTIPQKRGNCAVKSGKIAAAFVYSKMHPEKKFTNTYDKKGQRVPSGEGYEVYKMFTKSMKDVPLNDFMKILEDGEIDDLIYPSVVETMKDVFLKATKKGEISLANNILMTFFKSKLPIDIKDIKDLDGKNIIDCLAEMKELGYSELPDFKNFSKNIQFYLDNPKTLVSDEEKAPSDEEKTPSTKAKNPVSFKQTTIDKFFVPNR